MVTAINAFNRQQKGRFDRGNGEKEGIDNIDETYTSSKKKFKCYFIGAPVSVSAIDSVISSAVRDSSKLSLTKVLHDGRMETTITAEKDNEKRNSTDLWSKNGYSSSKVCDFSLEKADLPEMTIFYINQAYLSYNDNKKIYYTDVYIIGQVVAL